MAKKPLTQIDQALLSLFSKIAGSDTTDDSIKMLLSSTKGKSYEKIGKEFNCSRTHAGKMIVRAGRRINAGVKQFLISLEKYKEIEVERNALRVRTAFLEKKLSDAGITFSEKDIARVIAKETFLATPIRQLAGLSPGAMNSLMNNSKHDLKTMGDVVAFHQIHGLLSIDRFGKKYLTEVKKIAQEHGVSMEYSGKHTRK